MRPSRIVLICSLFADRYRVKGYETNKNADDTDVGNSDLKSALPASAYLLPYAAQKSEA
jgi:hypothetical protein